MLTGPRRSSVRRACRMPPSTSSRATQLMYCRPEPMTPPTPMRNGKEHLRERAAGRCHYDADPQMHDADPGLAGRRRRVLPGLTDVGEESVPRRRRLVEILVSPVPVEPDRRGRDQRPRRPRQGGQRLCETPRAVHPAVPDSRLAGRGPTPPRRYSPPPGAPPRRPRRGRPWTAHRYPDPSSDRRRRPPGSRSRAAGLRPRVLRSAGTARARKPIKPVAPVTATFIGLPPYRRCQPMSTAVTRWRYVNRRSSSRRANGRAGTLHQPPGNAYRTSSTSVDSPAASGSKRCSCSHAAKGPATCRSLNDRPGTQGPCSATQRIPNGPIGTRRVTRVPASRERPDRAMTRTRLQGGVKRSRAPARACHSNTSELDAATRLSRRYFQHSLTPGVSRRRRSQCDRRSRPLRLLGNGDDQCPARLPADAAVAMQHRRVEVRGVPRRQRLLRIPHVQAERSL